MYATSPKLLIVNADDFGITEGATDSIVACHRAGAVSSTTFMSTMPAAAYAAEMAHAHPDLGVGLHFNLTLGRPRSLPRSLTGHDGLLLTRGELVRRTLTGRVRLEEVRAELEAQHEAMKALGLQPTHLDSHQHVHSIPRIFQVVAGFAAEQKLPMRMPWRWAGHAQGKTVTRKLKEAVLGGTLRILDRERSSSVPANDGFCSVFDLPVPADQLSVEHYRMLLAPYRSGVVELMVHPAYVDEDLRGKTAITGTSGTEARLLTDPAFPALVNELNFQLVSFRSLMKGSH